jgi:hypothetical protein
VPSCYPSTSCFCEELCLSNLKSEIQFPLSLSHSCNSCAFVVQSSRPDQSFRPRTPTTCPFLTPPVFLKGVISMTYKRISPAPYGQIRPPIGQKPTRKRSTTAPKTSKRPLNWSRYRPWERSGAISRGRESGASEIAASLGDSFLAMTAGRDCRVTRGLVPRNDGLGRVGLPRYSGTHTSARGDARPPKIPPRRGGDAPMGGLAFPPAASRPTAWVDASARGDARPPKIPPDAGERAHGRAGVPASRE